MYAHRFAIALACVSFFLFQTVMTAHPVDESAEESTDSLVDIPDAALRRAFEAALDKSAGDDITQAEMATVRSLGATRVGVSDLTGLEYATQLTTLRLQGNPITDLSPLKTLTQLKTLYLSDCWITDISPLSGLNQLNKVNLQNNRITDVSPLLSLPKLMWVELNNNAIADVSAFQQATAPILLLGLTGNQIVDVSPLAAFMKRVGFLCVLTLSGNPITDFSPFSGLTLESCDFEIPVESTEASIDIPNPLLRKSIRQALNKALGEPLTAADMAQLKKLRTGATDFTGLEHAVNLETLEISATDFSDLGPLVTKIVGHLKKLKSLSITGDQYNPSPLVDISPLSKLAQLTGFESLSLYHHQLSDISPLTSLTGLKRLKLYDCDIVDVSPLAPLMKNLVSLDLYGNHISDFSPIAAHIPQENGKFVNTLRYDGITHQNLDADTEPADKVVNIPDAGLRAALEAALGKESGEAIMRTEMEALTTLDASNRGIRDTTGLGYATGLTALNLTNNEITNAWVLRELTALVRLELAGNKLTGMPLSYDSLQQLTYLDISRNLILNVNTLSLQTLSSLTTLNVAGNQIADISPLATLTALNALYLSNNPDTDYAEFAALLSTLDAADFSYDPEVEIPDANLRRVLEEALDKTAGETITQTEMETLRNLNAKHRGIVNLTGLEYAINLRKLNLAQNRIEDVSILSVLTKLRNLDLRRNRISDFSAIAGLTDNLKRYKKGNQKTGKSKNTPTLNADVNRDNVVDALDLDIVSRYTGSSLDSVDSGLYPDVNGDGRIDTQDVLAVTERLGGQQ